MAAFLYFLTELRCRCLPGSCLLYTSKAFKLIKNNETIFLDISTTNIELAKLLATSNMRVVVVSNMIDILQILATNPSITAIGTGGTMYQTVNGFMGAATIEVIKQYSFDRAFIGSCGVDMTDCAITTLEMCIRDRSYTV